MNKEERFKKIQNRLNEGASSEIYWSKKQVLGIVSELLDELEQAQRIFDIMGDMTKGLGDHPRVPWS